MCYETIDVEELPKKLKELLGLVTPDDSAIFHGSYAKAVLGWYLMKNKKITRSISLDAVLKGESLPDLALFYVKEKNIDELEARFISLQNRFATVGVTLNPVDVDDVQGDVNKPDDIEKYLIRSDLTINEAVLVPAGALGYILIYSDICMRDTLAQTGMLSGESPGTYRIDRGRKIGSNAGIARLLKFLIEGKVECIYLPEWWLELNALESKKMSQESLGGYGLVLAERYRDNKKLQQKLMRVLNNLKITDIADYSMYLAEQHLLYEHRNEKKFVFSDARTFRQIQEQKEKQRQTKNKSKDERAAARKDCQHEIVEINCRYCNANCTIRKCTKCTYFRVIPKGQLKPVQNIDWLRCSQNWQKSSFGWDKEGFFYIDG